LPSFLSPQIDGLCTKFGSKWAWAGGNLILATCLGSSYVIAKAASLTDHVGLHGEMILPSDYVRYAAVTMFALLGILLAVSYLPRAVCGEVLFGGDLQVQDVFGVPDTCPIPRKPFECSARFRFSCAVLLIYWYKLLIWYLLFRSSDRFQAGTGFENSNTVHPFGESVPHTARQSFPCTADRFEGSSNLVLNWLAAADNDRQRMIVREWLEVADDGRLSGSCRSGLVVFYKGRMKSREARDPNCCEVSFWLAWAFR
jgi:hypothetical protein